MDNLYFEKSGTGKALILLHGFPLNHTIWNGFKDNLTSRFSVYTPDLPGFGKSALPSEKFSIKDIGGILLNWIEEQGIKNPVIVGHSLGGYVALAMIQKSPDKFSGLCLFHSIAGADSEEKKEARTKTAEFVMRNGAYAFTSNFIPPLFADQSRVNDILRVKDIATQTSAETVIGYLMAMRDREDRTHVISSFTKPILMLAGERDGLIPVAKMHEQASKAKNGNLCVLQGVGHMGMLEAANTCADQLQRIFDK